MRDPNVNGSEDDLEEEAKDLGWNVKDVCASARKPAWGFDIGVLNNKAP